MKDRLFYYILKSLQEKNIYSNKLQQYGGYNGNNIIEILEFIKTQVQNIHTQGHNKYLIILYGPPASGKTYNLQEHLTDIERVFRDPDGLSKDSYININTDEIITSTDEYQQAIKDGLQPEQMMNKYHTIRRKIQNIGDILLEIAKIMEVSVIIETTGGSYDWYQTNLITDFRNRGYKICIIYPYVRDFNILCQKSKEREVTEKRFIDCKDIIDLAKKAYENFHNIVMDVKFIPSYHYINYFNQTYSNNNKPIIYYTNVT